MENFIDFNREFAIFTDLEPDDVLAIYTLLKYKKQKFVLFIVGEGNSNIKVERMSYFAKLMKNDGVLENYRILKGFPSEKDYFNEGLAESIELKEIPHCLTYNDVFNDDFFKNKILENETFNMIYIKPVYELLFIPDNIANLTHFICYGSFNIRTVSISKNPIEFPKIDNTMTYKIMEDLINNKFKSTFLFDTFNAFGSNNSINGTKNPEFFLKLENSNQESLKYFYKLMLYWNMHILDDCIDTMRSILPCNKTENDNWKTFDLNCEEFKNLDEKQRIRFEHYNLKPALNIFPNINKQFVNADTGLISVLLDESTTNKLEHNVISFNEQGYPQISQSNCDKYVYLYKSSDSTQISKSIQIISNILFN